MEHERLPFGGLTNNPKSEQGPIRGRSLNLEHNLVENISEISTGVLFHDWSCIWCKRKMLAYEQAEFTDEYHLGGQIGLEIRGCRPIGLSPLSNQTGKMCKYISNGLLPERNSGNTNSCLR